MMKTLGRWLRDHRTLLTDSVLSFFIIGYGFTVNTSTAQFRDPAFAAPFQHLPGFTVVFFCWGVAAFLLFCLVRTRPLWVCWSAPLLLLFHLIFFPTSSSSITVTFYTMVVLGRYAQQRWRPWLVAAALVGTALATAFRSQDFFIVNPFIPVAIGGVWLMLGFFWLWGTRLRDRDMELRALRDRASLAAISERTRIAREMHDIVAHSLTAIIVQADGGRYSGRKDPHKAVETLDTIANTARESLDQMRGLLSVLRTEDSGPELASAPGTDAIPGLIREARAGGMQVKYQVSGNPRHLDATRELTIFRIVQECLTNAMRHSGEQQVTIDLAWSDKDMVIDSYNPVAPQHVWDSGSGEGDGASSAAGVGRGLTGIRERAGLHGGRIDIDKSEGFRVTARIPTK
ncbi:sensor histidine kinase [Corynebacterium flavescens]|uniref:sensor histidine kinase n=1 Tax=Corynebacterium flavescens TaxID=28028 RepID=UPI003F8EB937